MAKKRHGLIDSYSAASLDAPNPLMGGVYLDHSGFELDPSSGIQFGPISRLECGPITGLHSSHFSLISLGELSVLY